MIFSHLVLFLISMLFVPAYAAIPIMVLEKPIGWLLTDFFWMEPKWRWLEDFTVDQIKARALAELDAADEQKVALAPVNPNLVGTV